MLVAATGLAGAGKTTSLECLAAAGAGACFYVGGIVRDEIAARSLALTPEHERIVREELRASEGMAALARRAASALRSHLSAGETVLIDAICNIEEADFYRATFGPALKVIAIAAPFEVRAARLAVRRPRPMSAAQLRARDAYERDRLAIGEVIDQADATVSNTGTLADLERELRARLAALGSG